MPRPTQHLDGTIVLAIVVAAPPQESVAGTQVKMRVKRHYNRGLCASRAPPRTV